jgi:hypothetical protein
MYDVPVLSPLPSLHLPPIISNHDFENNLPSGPPMSPLPTPPMSPSNGSSMNNSYSPSNSMMNGNDLFFSVLSKLLFKEHPLLLKLFLRSFKNIHMPFSCSQKKLSIPTEDR